MHVTDASIHLLGAGGGALMVVEWHAGDVGGGVAEFVQGDRGSVTSTYIHTRFVKYVMQHGWSGFVL